MYPSVCCHCTRCSVWRPGPSRLPQRGDCVHAGVGGGAVPRAPPAVAGALSRPGTVTRPPGSTIVRPPGSGNDPWRNHAGDPSTAGPLVGGGDCENPVVPPSVTLNATAATPTYVRPVISTSRRVLSFGSDPHPMKTRVSHTRLRGRGDDYPSDAQRFARPLDAPHQRAAQVRHGHSRHRHQREDHQTLVKLRAAPERDACGDPQTEGDELATRAPEGRDKTDSA